MILLTMSCLYLSANPTVNNVTFTAISSTTINLAWSSPADLVPISYEIVRHCHRLCVFGFPSIVIFSSVSSPHQSTGIPPYTQCFFSLSGQYESERFIFPPSYSATTLSAGKVLSYD